MVPSSVLTVTLSRRGMLQQGEGRAGQHSWLMARQQAGCWHQAGRTSCCKQAAWQERLNQAALPQHTAQRSSSSPRDVHCCALRQLAHALGQPLPQAAHKAAALRRLAAAAATALRPSERLGARAATSVLAGAAP